MTQLTADESAAVRKDLHTSPCPWSLGAMGAVTLLIVLGGAAIGSLAWDIRDLRDKTASQAVSICETQTDIKYIRLTLERIEAALVYPRP